MKWIAYNLATRNRPEALRAVIDNIKQMSSAVLAFDIQVNIDTDDNSDYEWLDYDRYVRVNRSPNTSKIQAINRYEVLPDDGINKINISDDQRFIVKGFDTYIREYMADGTGFLHLPSEVEGRRICTLSILSREYYEHYGYIYHPDYYSLWADNEATEVAKRDGVYKFVDHQLFTHLHYSNQKAVYDQLYKRNNTYTADKGVYQRRKAANFPQ